MRVFRIGLGRGPLSVVHFVNLMFRALRPEMERLQEEKEEALRAYRAAHPDRDPFEDRSLEILGAMPVDPRARLAAVEAAGPPAV